jgi:hypothetical protein
MRDLGPINDRCPRKLYSFSYFRFINFCLIRGYG